ncbi:MAG: phenylalanine--tRNA ligase subunit beta [Candidatus Micrarchaeaceae archaeon]
MAVVNFSLKLLKELGVDMDKLDLYVDAIGMEVEKKEGDDIYIDITPNRPDLLDIFGFARALKYFGRSIQPKNNFYSIKNDPETMIIVSKSVDKVRPAIAAMSVKNANLEGGRLKYIIDFMEKLSETYGRKRKKIAMGLHSTAQIKQPFYYDAKKEGSFVPLGGSTSMDFEHIVTEHQKGMQYGYTLGKAKLYPTLSDSTGNIMSLIPIINSDLTKVRESTKNLLVDVTGTSEAAVLNALNLVACMFIDLGSDVYPCIIRRGGNDIATPQLTYTELKLKPIDVGRALGVSIEPKDIIMNMNRMGYDGAAYGRYVLAYVPPYRVDVLNQQDVIEDIAIGYGYGNIKPMPVVGASVGIAEEQSRFMDKLSGILLGLGFSEAINGYLTNENTNFKNMERSFDKNAVVRLAYSKVEIYTMLRTSVLPGLLQNLARSADEPMPQKLFELGRVFGIKDKVFEKDMLALASEHSKANFAEMKSYVEALLHLLGIKYELAQCSDPAFIKGRCAEVHSKNITIGRFGELSPAVLSNFGLGEMTAAAEIDIEPLFIAITQQNK